MAADEASLSTDTLSTSEGLTEFRSPSTPSMRMSALPPAPMLPVPRMLMEGLRDGLPSENVTFSPGIRPCSERDTLLLARSAICLLSICSTAPTRFAFFAVP